MAVGFTRERERGGEGGDHTISHESGRQQACSGALSRHALFRQRQADVAVDQAVAHAVGERLAEAVGKVGQTKKRSFPSHGYPVSFPCRKPLMRQAFCELGASWISAGALKDRLKNCTRQAWCQLLLHDPELCLLGALRIPLRA